jgi:uncharacterized protein YndB with AHSA1/START domain
MTVSVEVTVERPPEQVFPVVADGERLPEWMEDFERVEQVSEGAPALGTEYRYKMRRAPESTFQWSEFEPGRRVRWSGPPVKAGPGSLEPRGGIDVEPAAEGSRVRVTLDPVPRGAMKLLLPIMRRSMRNGAVQNLSRLKALLER